jgi:hypothetical protein
MISSTEPALTQARRLCDRLFYAALPSGEDPLLPQIGYVFLVLTMRGQGPFRHGSGIGPRKLTRSTRQRGEQMTWDQWPGSYLKESWSLVR